MQLLWTNSFSSPTCEHGWKLFLSSVTSSQSPVKEGYRWSLSAEVTESLQTNPQLHPTLAAASTPTLSPCPEGDPGFPQMAAVFVSAPLIAPISYPVRVPALHHFCQPNLPTSPPPLPPSPPAPWMWAFLHTQQPRLLFMWSVCSAAGADREPAEHA